MPGSTAAVSSPTLIELAEELGLAKSTVSNALRGRGRVAAATVARVKAAAIKSGYRPDPLLSALSARHAKSNQSGATIAAIVYDRKSWHDAQALTDAGKLGFQIDPHFLEDYRSQTALARVLRVRGTAGVIFRETPSPIKLEPDVWNDFIGVYCGPYPAENSPFPVVRYNAFDAAILTWQEVQRAGYERIGWITGHHGDGPSSLDRKTIAGFQLMQQTLPRTRRVPPLIGSIPDLCGPESTIGAWAERYQPDAVIGNFAALSYPLTRLQTFPFASTRISSVTKGGIAGCLVNRDHVEWEALCYLESRLRNTYAGRRQSLAIVIEPQWRPDASLPNRIPSQA